MNIQYDKSGNILSLVRNGSFGQPQVMDALAYSYTSGTNRLAEVTDASGQILRGATYSAYTYDADGAVTRIDALRYSAMDFDTDLVLDRRKLPVAVSQYDMEHDVTTTVASWYSASGERYAKAVDVGGSGPSERMVLGFAGASGREAVAGVFTGTTGGVLKYWNVTSPSGEVLGRVLPGSGGVRYYGKDHLGSVRVVVDGGGVVKERHDYDAWGGELEGRSVVESVTGSERYTGHAWDGETAWLYAGARLYDPFVARWMARDALFEKHPEWNPYNYVLGNPLGLVDPDGHQIQAGNMQEAMNAIWQRQLYSANQMWHQGVTRVSRALMVGYGAATALLLAPEAAPALARAGSVALRNPGLAAEVGTAALQMTTDAPLPSPGIGDDVGRAARAGASAARSSASSIRLRAQLAFQEAGILDARATGLTRQAIRESVEVPISGGVLTNPSVVRTLTSNGTRIGDWGKFTTRSIEMPGDRRAQIHFYMHRITGATNFEVDFKIKGVMR